MALAAIALVLTAVGIHGVMSYLVSRRAHEFGVRRALGASGVGIVRLVTRDGAMLLLVVIVPGLLLAYAAARWMGALLFGVQPGDPMTFAIATGVCAVTAIAGCLRPALRAARTDPISALRAD